MTIGILRTAVLLTGCWLLLTACSYVSEDGSLPDGKQLAQTHCGGCHRFPEPSLLDKTTWRENVLPVMGLHLGLLDAQGERSQKNLQTLLLEGNYPTQPQLTRADWEKIKAHYEDKAPPQLDSLSSISLPLTALFTERAVPLHRSSPPAITCVKVDTLMHRIYAADAGVQTMFVLSVDGQTQQSVPQQPTISSLTWVGPVRKLLATHLGFSLAPHESAEGYLSWVNPTADAAHTKSLPDQLVRPTQTLSVDLVGDDTEELLTCNFGYRTGRLSYWKLMADGSYTEVVLREEAGALQAQVQDTNEDGRNDIIVLFAQGDERIVRYENQEKDHFREQVLLHFPPSYGSTSFALHDFNGDGHPDILYTCGDNADYSPILKPYHGVYVFLNQDDGMFEQAYFFPMHGAYRAMACDYDQDGDLDIAGIAFFADYARAPERSFVYLENQGNLSFTPTTRPIHTLGRWMTMDAGDVDSDGDTDIILGSYTRAAPFGRVLESWQSQSGVLWLENTLLHKSSERKGN